jgi:hypothetical protein
MLDPERSETPPAEPSEPAEPAEPAEPTAPIEPKPTEHEPTAPVESGQSPADSTPGSPARSDWPAVAYWAAVAQPPQTTAPPAPAPTWTKAYELPSARSVVSAGLQLAFASSAAVRRASIYIGLLSLGAFGPVVILLLVGIGRLMSDPSTADTIASDPSLLFFEQPEIAQPLTLIYVLVIVGLVLLGAIGVDAQAIAIAMLAGVAAERPLRLAEAITRARQTFWRLVGAGLIVGVVSGIVSLVVSWPFLKPFDTNTGVSFIGSMIGILVVSPWAFAATSIVLGEVGVFESLRRSVRLFRARPRIALVVVLFTIVTAAIQTLAFGAGLDVAIRVGELFQLELDQGPISLILPGILVLAFVIAFGSLTFTIAAIVAAPQVAAFLGLTFHSGGLERARAKEGFRPGLFHWVSVPMAVAMGLIVIVAVAGLPLITNFQARAPSAALSFLRTAAEPHAEFLFPFGEPTLVEDPAGDHGGGAAATDLVLVDYAFVPAVPEWLLTETFECGQPNVACQRQGLGLDDGAFLFVLRMPAEVDPSAGCDCAWTVVFSQSGTQPAPSDAGTPYPSATDAFVASVSAGTPAITRYKYSPPFKQFVPTSTRARSTWLGQDVVLLIPAEELQRRVVTWDAQASTTSGESVVRDRLATDDHLLGFVPPPDILVEDAFGDFE